MTRIELTSLFGIPENTLLLDSIRIGEVGRREWYVARLPAKKWGLWAWDPYQDVYERLTEGSRESVYEFAHQRYREIFPAEFTTVEWITSGDAGELLHVSGQAVRRRVYAGSWPLGHAQRVYRPGALPKVWEVTTTACQMPHPPMVRGSHG